eukprot:scaffold16081_cov57-Phaeocystis_antarctica.AAC.1
MATRGSSALHSLTKMMPCSSPLSFESAMAARRGAAAARGRVEACGIKHRHSHCGCDVEYHTHVNARAHMKGSMYLRRRCNFIAHAGCFAVEIDRVGNALRADPR